jgi:peroxiredoxin
MAPRQLPRLTSFPVFAEDHLVTKTLGATLVLPLNIRKKFPLKGQLAPDFILTDQEGRQCCLHDTLKLGRPVILFTFPLAGLPHCTKQSCLFRDALELTPIFDVMQAIVIGISQDPPAKGQQFAGQHKLTYPILYDYKRKVMDRYGVGKSTMGLFDTRSTFIIDPSGIVRGLAEGVYNSKDHVKFAEKWLVKLEEELSERSKLYYDYVAQDGDMIANMQPKKNGDDRVVQVVYGERRSSATSLATVTTHKSNKKDKWKNWKLFFSQISATPGRAKDETVLTAAFTAASSRQRAKDGEKAMTKGTGLVPPIPPRRILQAVEPTATPAFPATPTTPISPTTKEKQVWVHPLEAGWRLDKSIESSAVTPTSTMNPGHNRLASQSSSIASRLTSPSNPLVASMLVDHPTYSLDYLPGQVNAGVTSEILIGDAPVILTPLSTTTFGGAKQGSSDIDDGDHSNDHSTCSSDLEVCDAPLEVTEEDLSEPFTNLLRSFPRTPNPSTETRRLEAPPSLGLQRSISYGAHLNQLTKRPSLVRIRSFSSSANINRERQTFRRQSIDSDVTVPDKHTSFDQHHQDTAKKEELQRTISTLSQNMNQESLMMVAMLLQMCNQQQQDKEQQKLQQERDKEQQKLQYEQEQATLDLD